MLLILSFIGVVLVCTIAVIGIFYSILADHPTPAPQQEAKPSINLSNHVFIESFECNECKFKELYARGTGLDSELICPMCKAKSVSIRMEFHTDISKEIPPHLPTVDTEPPYCE